MKNSRLMCSLILRRASRWNRIAPGALLAAAVCLPCASLGHGQAGQTTPPTSGTAVVLMAGQVHKNLKLLKGIPEDELMDTMGFFSAALGVGCRVLPRLGQHWQLARVRRRKPDEGNGAQDDAHGRSDQ